MWCGDPEPSGYGLGFTQMAEEVMPQNGSLQHAPAMTGTTRPCPIGWEPPMKASSRLPRGVFPERGIYMDGWTSCMVARLHHGFPEEDAG